MGKQREKYLHHLPKNHKKRILQALEYIFTGQRDKSDITPLVGHSDHRRCRVGDRRIIFKKTSDKIEIVKIKPRGDVY